MTFDEVWEDVRDIDGWLTRGQGQMLDAAARRVPSGETIVEIGSHHGRSTIILARAKPDAADLVAVDPYDDPRWGGGEAALSVFHGNLDRRGLAGEVTHIRGYGADAGRAWTAGPVGLLFVDGAHDFPAVSADIDAWSPHLSPNATVLVHDTYSSPGVTRAVFQRFFASGDFTMTASSRSLVAFSRRPQTLSGRAVNAARMSSKLPWFARNIAIKLAVRQGWTSIPPLLGHSGQALPY